jgi:hypothetical protein
VGGKSSVCKKHWGLRAFHHDFLLGNEDTMLIQAGWKLWQWSTNNSFRHLSLSARDLALEFELVAGMLASSTSSKTSIVHTVT